MKVKHCLEGWLLICTTSEGDESSSVMYVQKEKNVLSGTFMNVRDCSAVYRLAGEEEREEGGMKE